VEGKSGGQIKVKKKLERQQENEAARKKRPDTVPLSGSLANRQGHPGRKRRPWGSARGESARTRKLMGTGGGEDAKKRRKAKLKKPGKGEDER